MNLKTTILAAILSFAGAIEGNSKDVYGFMTGNSAEDGSVPIGMFKYDTANYIPVELKQLSYSFWGGAYADGKYYMILSDDYSGYIPEGLCTFDIENAELQLRYSQQNYQCADLTYDYSTGTMYGVQIKNGGEAIQSQLITIDLEDGRRTVIGKLSQNLQAIACDYYGIMLGIGSDGILYDIDKTNGKLARIGQTGIKASTVERQSLEFDRASGQLYWSGLDNQDDAFLAELNPATGEPVSKTILYDNSLIVGLHIPFKIAADDAPAKPVGLTASSDGSSVTLNWANPSLTFDGRPLSSELTKVEVLRGTSVIHTETNVKKGESMNFTDSDASGMCRYYVFAYNEAGRGEGASIALMAGEDIPTDVTDLTARKEGSSAIIEWKAPETGQNGGMIKPENLTYTVIRQPGNVSFENISGTSFTDSDFDNKCYYKWTVIAENKSGKSEGVTSNTVEAGEPLTLPFSTAMQSDLERAQWRIDDANGDGNTWVANNDGGYTYLTSWTNTAEDHLISVSFALQSGKKYVADYTISAPEMFSSENFTLSLQGENGETILDELNNYTNNAPETRRVSFTVETDGEYRFDMAALSFPGQWLITISSFSLREDIATDAAIKSFTAPGYLKKDEACDFVAKVKNMGSETLGTYTVNITDEDNNVIAEKTVTDPLEPSKESDIVLSVILPKSGTVTLSAHVSVNGDAVTDNNVMTSTFTVLDSNETYIEAGGKDALTNYPFWFEGYSFCYAQTVYLKEEIGIENVEITQLNYAYNNMGDAITGKNIKVYMANTMHGSVLDGWMESSAMELVFDGAVDFVTGENTLTLNLAKPFKYTGNNICVLCEKENDATTGNIGFHAQICDEVRTAIYNSDIAGVSLSGVKGATRLNYIKMLTRNPGTSEIENIGTDNDSLIRLVGRTLIADTESDFTVRDLSGRTVADASGVFSLALDHLHAGIYIIEAHTDGQKCVRKFALR